MKPPWLKGIPATLLALLLVAASGLVVLVSCQPSSLTSRETVLRETFGIFSATGDTTKFASYAAAATADTAAWNETLAEWKHMRALLSSVLGQLGYGTGPFTWEYGPREHSALSRFQLDLGIPVTGQLDSLTVRHLLEAQAALSKADIKLPELSVNRFGQWFTADGTWKAITNKLAYPVNTVHIECNAITGECTVTSIEFISEALDQVDGITNQSLHVVHWDKDMLVAKSGGELDITLTINVPAKDVTWTQEQSGVLASLNNDEELRRNSEWRSTLPGAVRTGPAEPDTLHPQRMALKLVNGMMLSPPFDGGDLKEVHEQLFKVKERYLALQRKNMVGIRR